MDNIKRNIGIELLRVVAMWMIVVGHVVKFMSNYWEHVEAPNGSFALICMHFLHYVTLVAVDVYAMITGYVMVGRTVSYRKLLPFWLMILFYSLGEAGILRCLGWQISRTQWISFLSPVTHNLLWYVTAYIGMFVFLPLINKGIENIGNRDLGKIALSLFVIFSLLPMVFRNRYVFGLDDGYSAIWLLVCYVLGATLKRWREDIARYFSTRGMIWVLVGIYCLFLAASYCEGHGMLNGPVERIRVLYDNYISPITILYAATLLLLFERFEWQNAFWRRSIALGASVTLPVYLVHCHPLIWLRWFAKPTFHIQDFSVWGMLGTVFVISAHYCPVKISDDFK